MKRLLEYQADRIEAVLASHRILARIQGGVVTPRLVRFDLTLGWGVKVGRIKALSEEIALSLGAPAARINRQGSLVQIEVPREKTAMVRLLPLCQRLAHVPPCTAVLGLDEGGTPLLLRLSSPDVAHVLIAGTTGCGKTALARSMVASLALHSSLGEVQLVLIDVTGSGYRPLARLPHLLRPVVEEIDEAVEVLNWLVSEMERRSSALNLQKGEAVETLPRLVVFIDELADLVLLRGAAIEKPLTRLLQRGRGAGIHVVACTQKPTTEAIGSLVKGNFPVRLVGSVASAEDARVAAGVSGTQAERLAGRGDFLLVVKGSLTRLQAAYIAEHEMDEVMEQLGESRPTLRPFDSAQDRLRSGHVWARLPQVLRESIGHGR
jgi:S-DNA-T family DNA segregation ATPase FtsK/SpoIIIE